VPARVRDALHVHDAHPSDVALPSRRVAVGRARTISGRDRVPSARDSRVPRVARPPGARDRDASRHPDRPGPCTPETRNPKRTTGGNEFSEALEIGLFSYEVARFLSEFLDLIS
jgi:hypothetical protein